MRLLKILGSTGLIALLAFAISACQKSNQTNMSATNDTTQVSQGYGSAPDRTAPEAQPGAQGATLPPTYSKSTTKHTTKSGAAKGTTNDLRGSNEPSHTGTPSTYAERRTLEIPAGTNFEVEMVTPVDTRTSNVGERVEGKLAAPLVVNGTVVAEAGASVTGRVADLQRASKHKGKDDRAFIALDFTTIETVDGPKPLHSTVANAEGKLVAKSTSTRDKLIIGGGAVAGAVIGKVAGGSTKSTIIGAVGGAAAGTGAVLMAKGHELEIPEGAKVSLRVDRPIVIVER